MTSSFDLSNLSNLDLPCAMCRHCLSLLRNVEIESVVRSALEQASNRKDTEKLYLQCITCKRELTTAFRGRASPLSYISQLCESILAECGVCKQSFQSHNFTGCAEKYSVGELVRFARVSNLLKNQQFPENLNLSLEQISSQIYVNYNDPISGLFALFALSKRFIHFTSYGISTTFIGALKATSARGIKIRGVVSSSKLNDYTKETLEALTINDPNISIKVISPNSSKAIGEIPHQKLLIIDGLIALGGSCNLTDAAWQKIAKGLEILEVKTRNEDVVSYNNKYFSPLWNELSKDEIDIIPF